DPLQRPGARRAAAPGGVAVHHRQVVDADVAGGAAVQVRLAGHAHQRRIAAVAGAVDADALRVGDAGLDRPAGRIGQVVLHAPAPFLYAGLRVRPAIAAGATVVHPQHRIAGRGQDLAVVVELPAVADPVRPAVRQQHHRLRAVAGVERAGEVAV